MIPRAERAPLWALVPLGLIFLVVVPRLLWRDATGLWVGHEHLWSDWPLHIGMLRRFADCPPDQWLAHHPMLGGIPLRYPFVAAALSGFLMRVGLTVEASVLVPTVVLLLVLVAGLWRLWRTVLGSGWRATAAVWLFFLAAGPGGFTWLLDIAGSHGAALLDPPREYGRVDDYQWYAGNFLVGMLLPQRAFLPGMAAGVWILAGAARLLASERPRPWAWAGLGVALGLLPAAHIHSFLAVSALGLGLLAQAGRQGVRAALWALPPAALLGGALLLTVLRPTTPYPGFVSLKIGYQAEGALDWWAMWWRIWGIALPMAAWGTLLQRRRGIALAAWGLFALANLVLFQPIAWDNAKVFLWVYAALCGPMACVLARLWRRVRPLALLAAFALTLTGIANVVALARTDLHRYQILSTEDLSLGDAIRQKTPSDAVFLTGMDTTNAPMVWGARPIYLGFGGWMPNFHFDHREREADVRAIYPGAPDAEARLRASGVSYVLVGPGERDFYGARDAWFRERFPVAFNVPGRVVYRVRP